MGCFAQVGGAVELNTANVGNRESRDFRIEVAKSMIGLVSWTIHPDPHG